MVLKSTVLHSIWKPVVTVRTSGESQNNSRLSQAGVLSRSGASFCNSLLAFSLTGSTYFPGLSERRQRNYPSGLVA